MVEKITYECAYCSKKVTKYKNRQMNHRFCSRECKSEWQRLQKPVTREWLYQKYIVEGLDCTKIGKMVSRDPKGVWLWLKDFGIPTRPRGYTYKENIAFWEKGEESPFKGRKHKPESIAKMSESSKGPSPWLRGEVHHLFGKSGEDTPNWKGGVTPERQAFYNSTEWRNVAKKIWRRDKGTCQRCGKMKIHDRSVQFDIHHIVSFANVELRAEPSNLMLLCRPCHLWVHSRKNKAKLFIKE